MEKAYKNLGYFMLLLIPLAFLGFYKTYFNQVPNFEENITPFVHLHAFIATLWILLLIVQPILIRNRKFKLHRKLGKISYIIFPLLILSFIPRMIHVFHSEQPLNLFFPLADSILLVLFYSLAIYNKKTTPRHMRFMIGAATVFLGPTIGRIGPLILGLSGKLTQNLQYAIIYLILIGLILMDRKNGKNYRPYLFIIAAWAVHQIVFNLIFY